MDEERGGEMRRHRNSGKWHYTNTPVCGVATENVCSGGDCATVKLGEAERLLANPRASREDRLFALRLVVHLVGDIHQPLHAADNGDAGGNKVQIGQGENNLHKAWDSGILKSMIRRSNPQDTAQAWLEKHRAEVSQLAQGSGADWERESYRLAKTVAYGHLVGTVCGRPQSIDRLPDSYVDEAKPIIEARLVAAGVRIAYMLNTAVGGR
jgi:hypothetical protein